jgi:leucyl/phenylalanyl-tRNA--protein transferase
MNDEDFLNEDILLQPENMVTLYSRGAFPMADEDGKLNWYLPDIRTIIPLDNYNVPRSLRKFMEKSGFEYRFDYDYLSVIRNCADRETTWISEKLIAAYNRLYKLGYLHSVEVWKDNLLVGGLYGVAVRGAFFGESMFSKVTQASKSALVKLIEHLIEKDFTVLDVQYQTEHLNMFGATEISFEEFDKLLNKAYQKNCAF